MNDYKIEAIEENRVLKLTYLGPVSKKGVFDRSERLLTFQKENGNPSRILLNAKMLGVIPLSLQNHTSYYLIPEMAKNAGKAIKIAYLTGDNRETDFGIMNIAAKIGRYGDVEKFKNEEAAISWLEKEFEYIED